MNFENIRWKSFLLSLSFCVLASSAIALQDEPGDAETDDGLEPGQKLVVKEIRNEIEKICSVEIGMEIDRYHRFFKLDDEKRDQLTEAGEQIVKSHVEKFTDAKILETWGQVGRLAGAEDTGVVVNGRVCFLNDDDEDVNQNRLPKVSMCLFKTSMLFMVEFDSGSTTSFMQYQLKFKPTESEPWKEALSFLSDDDFDRFQEHRDEIKREKAVALILASLTVQLKLTDDQLGPTQQWIRDSMSEVGLGQLEVYGVAKSGFESLVEPPECFSEDQKKVLAGVKAMYER